MSWSTRLLGFALCTLVLSGCLKEMQADLNAQQQRLEELETKLEADRKELEGLMKEASAVVRRNSADQGVQIEELQKRVDQLQGLVAEFQNTAVTNQASSTQTVQDLRRQLTEMARTAGVDFPAQPDEVPADRKKHWEAAMQALRINEHSFSRALLREYAKKYPSDRRADDAQYWLGVSYLRQDRPADALGEFRLVISKYKKSDMIDETLYEMGDAFFRVRACKDAEKALETLIKNYRRSGLASKARVKLREIKAAGRSACDDGG